MALKPTWVSSVPMKMRRIRVRSLLAGCISCLRCVDQRSHMQIESLGVPLHSSPFLYVFGLFLRCKSVDSCPSAAHQHKSRDLFYGIVSVHIYFISVSRRLSLRSSCPHFSRRSGL